MMKKFTFLLLAAFVIAVNANADDNLTFNWAHSVDGYTTGGDNGIDLAKATDGTGYYALTQFGTSTDQSATGVSCDGATLYDHTGVNPVVGSPYYGTSMNGNMLLQKVDQAGNVLWFAYSKKGDIDHGNTCMAGTSDGGVVMVVKCRAWVEEAGLNNLMEFIDAQGNSTTINDANTITGEYRYLVAKVSGEGTLEWARVIASKVVLKGNKIDESYENAVTQNAKNNVYVYGVDVDDNDNIYLAGNFRTSLYFKKSDGGVAALVAKNNINWNGDSQGTVGDLFLAKLDKDGYYDSSLVSESTASLAFFDNVVYNDGNLYLNGRVTGDGTEYKIGDKVVNASTSYQTMFIASVSASDLSVNYVNTLTSVANSAGKFILQNKSVQYVNGSVYFTGLLNGGLANDGETEAFANSNATLLKAYVLKVDPATGSVQQSYVRTDGGIGGFFGVYVGQNNTYAFGYDMSKGGVLVKIANDTYSATETFNICTYGTVALANKPIIDGDNFVMMQRGGKGSGGAAEASYYGTDTKYSDLTGWGSTYYSYKINDAAAE